MNGWTAKRLRDLEIDEISLVDRPANQHGLVAIAKRDEGAPMPLFDADGNEVDQDELEVGEYAYDENGNEFFVTDEDTAAELGLDVNDIDDEYEDLLDDEGAPIGKSVWSAGSSGVQRTSELARRTRTGAAVGRARGAAQNLRSAASEYRSAGSMRDRAGRAARNAPGRAARTGGRVSRNTAVRAGAAGGAAGFAGGYGSRRKVEKSLGDAVYEQLSKAFTDADQLDVISKVADLIDEAREDAAEAWTVAKGLADERDNQAYYQLATQYDHLPVPPEQLAQVLKSASGSLSRAEMGILDRALSAQPVDYDELGFNGRGAYSDVMEEINALTADTIAKSDTGLSQAELTVGLLEQNPGLYDDYLAEQRQR